MVNWTVQIGNLIISVIIGTIFIHIGAKLAKISDATILKAFEVALIGAILALILGLVSFWGSLLALILVIAIIKYVYSTTWGKAFIAWILYIIVFIIVMVVLAVIIGVATYMALT